MSWLDTGMRWLIFTGLVFLAACDSPSPKFMGGGAQVVTVDDSRFRVFTRSGSRSVEAHRISFEPLPSLVATLEKAYRAIELATGCKVKPGSLHGDRAIILADVDCVLP